MKEEKKTGKDRTQQATRDETWSDERLATFLEVEPPAGTPADYNILLIAYRGMTAELFGRFLAIFVAAGHDVNVQLEDGSSFADLLQSHSNGKPYLTLLEQVNEA